MVQIQSRGAFSAHNSQFRTHMYTQAHIRIIAKKEPLLTVDVEGRCKVPVLSMTAMN